MRSSGELTFSTFAPTYFPGHFGPAIALVGLSYSPVGNVTMAVVLLTVVVGLNAGHYTGYLVS